MSKPQRQKSQVKEEMTDLDRLGLRISSMINHPIAQQQRWVKVHRLDTDGDTEWDQVMGLIGETDGIEMIFDDDDGSVTLRWEASSEDDPQVEAHDEFVTMEEAAPF